MIGGPGTAINAATITGGEEYTPGNVNNWGTDASGTRGVWNSEGAYINLRVSAELNTPSGLLTWSASNFMPQGYTIDESLLNSTTITDRDLVGTWVALDQTQGYSGNVVYDRGEDLVYFLTSEASINATGPVPASANWGGSSSITMFLEKIPVNELRGEGTTPLAKINSQSPIKAGFVGVWPTANIPDGWLLADGSAVSRTTYAELFAVYGTTYGAGDGSTTFNLPDYSGYVLAGVDADGSTLTGATLGADLGSETHTLTEAELPAHTHSDGTLAAALDGAHTHESVYVGSSGTASIDTGSNNHIIYRSCTGSSNCDATGNQGGGGLNANYWLNGTSSTPNSGETTTDGNHTHDITGATGSTGSGTAFSVVQPTKPVYWIVKAYIDRIEFAGLNEATAEKRGLVGPGTIDDPAFFGAGAVDSAAIDDGTITTDDLATDSVGSDEIASGAVGSDEVALNSLTANDLADNSVDTGEIVDGSIVNSDIAVGAAIAHSKVSVTTGSCGFTCAANCTNLTIAYQKCFEMGDVVFFYLYIDSGAGGGTSAADAHVTIDSPNGFRNFAF